MRVHLKRLSLTTAYQSYKSAIGLLHILASHEALTAVLWDHEIEQYSLFTSHTSNEVTRHTKRELHSYFLGKLQQFKTPLHQVGTPFQKECENYLKNIPYGETRSYLEQAKSIRSLKHSRAVAGANAANPISIIVPCHRIISANGGLGGYAGTLEVKQEILSFEKKHQ